MEEINDTGIKGFLKWFAVVQPGLYKKIAPTLSDKVPAAFSNYHAGGWRTAGMDHASAVKKLGYIGENGFSGDGPLGRLGDPVSVDFSNSLSQPITTDINNLPLNTVDVTTAANSGGESSGTTDLIGSIVKGISTLYLGKKQADIQQQVVNTQLQRAALGLPPLPASLANLGVPQVNVGLSSGSSALVIGGGIAALLALMFLGRKRGR